MNRKAKGTRNEHRAKKILEAAGYDVFRSRGSLGIVDLVAVNSSSVRFIEVKTNRVRRETKEQMREWKNVPKYASKEIWKFVDGQKEPVIEVYD
jgi:Holliday junction resolvase